MYRYDPVFNDYINRLTNYKKINKIPEKQLLKYANTFYQNQSDKITHVRVKGEPLYSQSFKGKMYIGKSIIVLGDQNTNNFPDIGSYPFEKLSKYFPVFYLEKLRYNSGTSQILSGIRNIDENLGLSGTEALINDIKTSYNQSEYFKAITSTLNTSNDVNSGILNILNSPLALFYQGRQIYNHFDLVGNHGIEVLINMYKNQDPTHRQSFYNFTDPTSGKPIIMEKSAMKQFLIGCFESLENKELAIAKLDDYIENTTQRLYQDSVNKLLAKMNEKEANPDAFFSEVGGLGFFSWVSDSRVVVDGLVFDKDIRGFSNSVNSSLDELKSMLLNQRKHLKEFIEKVLSLGEKIFEKDEELAAIINKAGV